MKNKNFLPVIYCFLEQYISLSKNTAVLLNRHSTTYKNNQWTAPKLSHLPLLWISTGRSDRLTSSSRNSILIKAVLWSMTK